MSGTQSYDRDTAGTTGTLPARPGHCRHGRDTADTAGTQPGLRHRVWDTIVVGKSSYSQDVVVLVEMPTGQPGRCRDNLVAVVITGWRRENRVAGSPSEQPGRRRVSRDVEKPTARMPLCWSRCRRVSQVAVGSAGSRSGKPGRGRDDRVAVGSAGTP